MFFLHALQCLPSAEGRLYEQTSRLDGTLTTPLPGMHTHVLQDLSRGGYTVRFLAQADTRLNYFVRHHQPKMRTASHSIAEHDNDAARNSGAMIDACWLSFLGVIASQSWVVHQSVVQIWLSPSSIVPRIITPPPPSRDELCRPLKGKRPSTGSRRTSAPLTTMSLCKPTSRSSLFAGS